MRKRKVGMVIWASIVSIIVIASGAYAFIQASYLYQAKHRLLALASDKAATQHRLTEIYKHRDDWWSDGCVGITEDGYIFYYDLHDSHSTDAIGDTNVFYLPDEKRLIVSHAHFCMDLSKASQPKNKSELLTRFTAGI